MFVFSCKYCQGKANQNMSNQQDIADDEVNNWELLGNLSLMLLFAGIRL